jgi:hypothetical protein
MKLVVRLLIVTAAFVLVHRLRVVEDHLSA